MSKLKIKSILNQSERLYQLPVPIIGITGGIATGKTTFSTFLKQKGYSVINADTLVKNIYSEVETINTVKTIAPLAIENSQINFKKLREIFFNDSKIKTNIENFIYSKLEKAFMNEFNKIQDQDFIFYDVPLLYERKIEKLFDAIILVYAPKEVQIERLTRRDQISNELAETIINQQISIEDKKKFNNIVIDNSNEDMTISSVEKFLSQIITE